LTCVLPYHTIFGMNRSVRVSGWGDCPDTQLKNTSEHLCDEIGGYVWTPPFPTPPHLLYTWEGGLCCIVSQLQVVVSLVRALCSIYKTLSDVKQESALCHWYIGVQVARPHCNPHPSFDNSFAYFIPGDNPSGENSLILVKCDHLYHRV